MTAVVMERSLTAGIGEAHPGVRVIHREFSPRRPWGARDWRPVVADDALSALTRGPTEVIALTRAAEADPGAACVAAVARLVGRPVLVLPEPLDAALWVAALAAEWTDAQLPDIGRALAVACGAASGHGDLLRSGFGEGDLRVPHLHPRVLGRWASRAFVACACCRSGGGLAGAACAGCGAPIPAPPADTPHQGGQVVPLRRIA